MVSAKTRKILEGLSGQHQIDLAASFGQTHNSAEDALAYLVTQPEGTVTTALQVLKAELERLAASGETPVALPGGGLRPQSQLVDFVCEKDLRFMYNKWVTIPKGTVVRLPKAVAHHAADVAKEARATYNMQSVTEAE